MRGRSGAPPANSGRGSTTCCEASRAETRRGCGGNSFARAPSGRGSNSRNPLPLLVISPFKSMRPPGACVVFTAVLSLAVAAPLLAQEEWENKTINNVTPEGFVHEPRQKNMELTGLRKGDLMTR